MCCMEEKRTFYVEDQESDKCCSSKVNNIQRSGGDSSRLSVCSRQLRKKKKTRGEETGPPIHTHTYRVDYDERKWICSFISFFFSPLLLYTYTTYVHIYTSMDVCIYAYVDEMERKKERCSVRKRPWFRRSLEVVQGC